MNPTSRIWLRGDDTPFSVKATAVETAQRVATAREECVEFVALTTSEDRTLIVDPTHVVAILEAVETDTPQRRCGFTEVSS